MPDYLIEIENLIENGLTGHIATLGAMNLGNGKWLLKTSMGIDHLRAALMQSCPEPLEIAELADKRELEALKLKWLRAGAANPPPLEDFAARMNAGRWRLRE